MESPGSLANAERIWLRVVGICLREGGAEPSSPFLAEVLVLTLNLLNFKKRVVQVGRRIALAVRGLESFRKSSAS